MDANIPTGKVCQFAGCIAGKFNSYHKKLEHLELVHSTQRSFRCFSRRCIVTCPSVKELRLHLKGFHNRSSAVESAAPQNSLHANFTLFKCQFLTCGTVCRTLQDFVSHLCVKHIDAVKECIIEGCIYFAVVPGTYRKHLRLKHKKQEKVKNKFVQHPGTSMTIMPGFHQEMETVDGNSDSDWDGDDRGGGDEDDNFMDFSDEDEVQVDVEGEEKAIRAQYSNFLNSLETMHNVPRTTVNQILCEITALAGSCQKLCAATLASKLDSFSLNPSDKEEILRSVSENPFLSLQHEFSSSYKIGR